MGGLKPLGEYEENSKIMAIASSVESPKDSQSRAIPTNRILVTRKTEEGGRHGKTILGEVNTRERSGSAGVTPSNYWAKAVRGEYDQWRG